MPRILPILLLGWAACLPALHAQGTCGPSPLGDPCPRGGIATTAAAEPSLNLGAGNPVHLATGNKYQQETDLPPNPQFAGIELVRHYNAQDPRVSALGRAWSFSYDTRLVHAGGRWQLTQADGSRVTFHSAQGDPMPGAQGRLSRDGVYWLWAWPDGAKLWFDERGDLARLHRADGSRVDILRHPAGGPLFRAISHVRNQAGFQLVFHYRLDGGRAYVVHVDTPVGRFHFDYTDGKPSTGPLLASVRRPDGMQRRYLYEAQRQSGNPQALTGIEIISAEGRAVRVNTWAYDAQLRAVLSIAGSPDSTVDKISLDYARAPGSGQTGLTIVRDAPGHETRFETALRGGRHLLLSASGAGCPTCPAAGTLAQYDPQGRLLSLNGTTLARDADGRIRQVRPYASGWPGLALDYQSNGLRASWASTLTGAETIQYNARRLPQRRQFANGDTVQFDYDAAGRPVRMAERNARHTHVTTLGWRGGLLHHVRHPHEIETRQYDTQRRMTHRTVRRGTHQHQEAFEYDTHHRLSRHHLPEGGMLAYRWAAHGRLAAIHWHDTQGRVHTVIDSVAGQPGYLYGNGLHQHASQNRQGQASGLALSHGGKLLWVQHNRYDGQGRVLEEQHAMPAVDHAVVWHYAYNRQSQLIGANGLHGKVQGAKADGAMSAQRESIWYAWNPDGSLAARRHNGVSFQPAVTRDASGLATVADGHDLTYGPGRRLETAARGGALLARYRHNAFGHRISRHAGATTTDYFYLDNRLVAEAQRHAPVQFEAVTADTDAEPSIQHTTLLKAGSDGSVHQAAGGALNGQVPFFITRRYIYAHQALVGIIDYQAGDPAQAALFWAHADLLGAARMLTDDAGRLRWVARYSPFGSAQQIAGDMSLDIRLPGQIHDSATGWHDNLLRTYMPQWGHYLEPDPLGPLPRNQALGYARQQPRRYADPLGLLLFAFDGTRHSADTQSNVWKMSLAYRDGPVFYHSGPGNSLYLDMDAALAFSAGRILDTQWLSLLNALEGAGSTLEYIPIDIIGFSRGAALARHFGNLIQQHMQGSLFSYTDAVRGPVTACLDLRFMGLFDTVAQFGPAGLRNANYDLTIAPAWEWVAHAVALHERRWIFPLTAIADAASDNVIEAPFIGAHADIGGGSLRDTDGQPAGRGDLADVALNWMLWQARAATVRFDLANPDDRVVSLPIVHDERPAALRYVQDGDRRVDTAGGAVQHAYQDDHPQLGRDIRAATEKLIARTEDWRHAAGSEVGTVDMAGYARWLYDELGWRDPPA